MSKPREFYRFEKNTAEPSTADIHIIDFIGDWIDDYWGFGVTAKAFIAQLAALTADVKKARVYINSPGGDVFAALNIANALREWASMNGRTVETIVTGLSASAATIIQMAGSVIKVSDNALVMIHNPWNYTGGEAKDFREMADRLDTVRGTIIATYKWHSKMADDDIKALMDAATWMDADTAITNGFATDKVEGLKAAASLEPGALAKLTVPEKYRDRVKAFLKPEQPKAPEAPQAAAASDVLRLCTEGACLDVAEALISANATLDQVKAKVDETKTARAAAATRETAIRTLCANSKCEGVANGLVQSGMSVDAVKAHLTTITAMLDKAAIDTSIDPDQGSKSKAQIDLVDVYAKRNT